MSTRINKDEYFRVEKFFLILTLDLYGVYYKKIYIQPVETFVKQPERRALAPGAPDTVHDIQSLGAHFFDHFRNDLRGILEIAIHQHNHGARSELHPGRQGRLMAEITREPD